MMRSILKPIEFFCDKLEHNEFIFDLDNTIYDENIFLNKSYLTISEHLKNFTNSSSDELHSYLWNSYLKNGRKNIFDKLIIDFSFDIDINVEYILKIFRARKKLKIRIFRYFTDYLDMLIKCNSSRYFIITNGNISQQKNKYSYLQSTFTKAPEAIIYANQYSPKPSNKSYKILNEKYNISNPIYIGDSDIDLKFSENSSIEFARILFKRNEYGFIDESSIMIEN